MGAGAKVGLLVCLAVLGAVGSAPAREWRSPWIGQMQQRATAEQSEALPLIAVTDTEASGEGTARGAGDVEAMGVDISLADLMADGSELAGVAPRAATSGIGSDVERDLFTDGVPLNAPGAPAPEADAEEFLY